MSRFWYSSRTSFSQAAAGIVTTLALLSSSAPAISAEFPADCDRFDTTSPTKKNPYSEAMLHTITQLKNYSGWEKLRNAAKVSGNDVEGICPAPLGPQAGLVQFNQESKALGLNVVLPTGRGPQLVPPEMVSKLLKNDSLSYAGAIVANMASNIGDRPNAPFIKGNEGFHNIMLLQSTLAAYSLVEHILFSAEAAADDKQNIDLNTLYKHMPAMVEQINDIHALALLAKSENRSLTESERSNAQEKILSIMLTSPAGRQAAARVAVASMLEHAVEDLREGRAVSTSMSTVTDMNLIKSRLQRLPGNLAESAAVRGYKAYWEARPEQDAASQINGELSKLPELAKQVLEQHKKSEQMQKSLPPGMILVPRQ